MRLGYHIAAFLFPPANIVFSAQDNSLKYWCLRLLLGQSAVPVSKLRLMKDVVEGRLRELELTIKAPVRPKTRTSQDGTILTDGPRSSVGRAPSS